MSALMKTLKFAALVNKKSAVVYTVVRNSHWNYEFKPDTWPKTEAERVAAAKKYNMLPEEYKPYPEDGIECTGDYPQLPDVPVEQRDKWYPYDYPHLKRNFNEPIHAKLEIYDETRYGSPTPLRYSYGFMLSVFLGAVSGIWLLYWLCEGIRIAPPRKPPQLYTPGVVHYTFEQTS